MTQMIFYKTDNNKLSLEELLEQLEKNEEEQLIAALKESVHLLDVRVDLKSAGTGFCSTKHLQ
jgi:hypothetical protein